METIIYQPRGVCSREIKICHENGIVLDLFVIGGCSGNIKAITALVKGMKIEDVIAKLKGIECGFKSTSCGDQIARALESIK